MIAVSRICRRTSFGSIKVIHGANDDIFDGVIGSSVSEIRDALADAFNIHAEALAFIDGLVVGIEYRLQSNDTLEFIYPWGRKAGFPVNDYGNVVITDGVPEGLVHVDLPRMGPTCKRVGIDYAKAIVGWSEVGRSGSRKRYPVTSGVVIRNSDLPKLEEALAEKDKKEEQQIDRLPILAALFTLNRRAKRCRDLAQTYYQNRMHGFAGKMKKEKEEIYELKGQVLHYMVAARILGGGKYHRFPGGNWAEVLHGDGYTFHRPCPPQEGSVAVEEMESVESKPKKAKEPKLAVAFGVVGKFLADKEWVIVYEWPPVIRPSRYPGWDDNDERDDDDDEDFLEDDDF